VGLDSLGRPEFAVTSHDLHAWPELYFDGIGWTRFEPTPGRGDVPSYADQSLADVPVPVNSQPASTVPSASARPSASAVPNAHDSSSSTEANGSSGGGTASWIWAASILLLGAIGLALPGPARGVQRNRRVRSLRGGTAPAVTAWREVLQSAHDFGVVIPETATPREAEALLGSGAAGAIPALARLRAAVERESYAEPTSPGAYAGAARDVLTVVGWLRSSAGRWQRVLARVAPRSLWSRAFSRVNRDG
jgi:hypothetical protein